MSNGYTAQEFIDFIDYLANKGLLKKATASARKAAAQAFLDILDEDEKIDIRSIDLDELATRFANIQGEKFTPQSLTTYKSRYKSAFKDFLSYRENPLGFKPQITQRKKRDKSKSSSNTENIKPTKIPTRSDNTNSPFNNHIFPIPIRADKVVQIAGLPHDLTESEANKIANVIKALAIKN